MDKVNLAVEFRRITEHWSPRIAAEVGDYQVRLAKLKGEFEWHSHADEDELFLVVEGRLRIRMRDRDVVLEPGELFVVPRGVEHLPLAEEEASVLLFEPARTVNTGGNRSERTRIDLERI